MKWIDEAVDSGAKLLTGGHSDGRLIEPAVFNDEVVAVVIAVYPEDLWAGQ